MVCCSTYIHIYVGPWTNKVIQIQNIFSLSILVMSETFPSQVLSAASREADPSSIAVGYIFRDVSPKNNEFRTCIFFRRSGEWNHLHSPSDLFSPEESQVFSINNFIVNLRSFSGCEKVPISGLGRDQCPRKVPKKAWFASVPKLTNSVQKW